MLVVETIARMRRDHPVRGVPIKKIARDFRISRNTVRKVFRGDEMSFGMEPRHRNQIHRLNHKMRRIVVGNTLAKVNRKQEPLIAVRRNKSSHRQSSAAQQPPDAQSPQKADRLLRKTSGILMVLRTYEHIISANLAKSLVVQN